MAAITIENIKKSYGTLVVLHDLCLEVRDGEFLVLVGPSGCGKSTALKILAGLEDATAGKVFIGGRDVTDVAPGKRDIAMVFQNYALYPHLTVRANMGFGLKMRGTAKAEMDARVADAARILGIEDYLDRRPRELSGGQRQRVALGRAIVREPQAFLMDEPLSNLDAKLRVQMRSEIAALHRRLQATTIYVTHDQTEAMTMADRIVIMRSGRVQQVADPETMYDRPVNLFVAGFIGSPGMNFIRAVADGDAIVVDGARLPVVPPAAVKSGQTVIVGCRPEHIALDPPEGERISLRVTNVEKFGSDRHIHLDVPEGHKVPKQADLGIDDQADRFIVRTEGRYDPHIGTPVQIGLPSRHVRFFDPDTGLALNRE